MKISVDGKVVSTEDTAIAFMFDDECDRNDFIDRLSKSAQKSLYLIPSDYALADVEQFLSETLAGSQRGSLVNV
jgi:hypothetical protein